MEIPTFQIIICPKNNNYLLNDEIRIIGSWKYNLKSFILTCRPWNI